MVSTRCHHHPWPIAESGDTRRRPRTDPAKTLQLIKRIKTASGTGPAPLARPAPASLQQTG